jgi:hypothetical protein
MPSCEQCTYYVDDSEPEGPQGLYACESYHDGRLDELLKQPEMDGNIPICDPSEDEAFPYDPAPLCFELDFWCSEFAKMVDGSDESLARAYKAFEESMKNHE